MKNLLFVMLAGPSQSGQNPYMSLIMMGLIIVVFYFFMIRPQMKRQKELKNFRAALKKGDKVITTGGIYGRIVELEEHTSIIEVDSNVRLKIDKAAILRDPSDMDAK